MVKNCCVIGCKSIWTPNSKVSFHKFPKNDELCTKWLEVLTVTNMSEHKRVCGLHFKSEDFMEFASTRRLKPDVVPSYDQDVPEDDCDVKSTMSEADSAADSDCTFVPSSPEPDDFDRIKMSPPTLIQTSVASQPTEGALTPMLPVTTKYIMCRICLATDRELFHMSERNILELYQELIGAQVGASRPQHVCWECARRLRALALFRRRALQANALLQTLPTEDSYMLISNKLKDHFSSKLKVTETKTQPDFEYKFSKTKHKYCLDPDDTDYTDKESIDESVYLEIDPEIKIDTDNDERFALEYSKVESEDDPTLENSMKVESDMSDDDDNMFESIEDTERTTPNHGLSSPGNNTKFISKMPESLPIFNASDIPPRKVVRNIAENATEIVLNKDIIDVTELSHEEQVENLVRKKDSAAFKEAKFKCMKCYRGYMDQDMYKWHASRHDIKNGAHVCSVCKVRFSRASQLAQHAAAEHTARYSCKQCPFITYKRRHAKHHEDFHTGGSFQCPYCPQAYANAPLYFKHVRLMHPPDCACELCGYMFLGAKEVEFHKQLKHKHDQAPLDGPHCEVCDVTFASDEAHDRHLRLSPRHASDRDQKKIPNPVVLVMKKWSLMPQPRGPRKRQSKDKPRECEQFQTDDMRPLALCYICHAQLNAAHKLTTKCLKAEELFTVMLNQLLTDKTEAPKLTLIDRSPLIQLSVSKTQQHTIEDVHNNLDVVVKDEIPIFHENFVKFEEQFIQDVPDIDNSIDIKPYIKPSQSRLTITLPLTGASSLEDTKQSEVIIREKKQNGLNKATPDDVSKSTYDMDYDTHCDTNERSPTRDKFFCHLCNKSFKYKHGLKYHNILHTGEKPYVCGVCGECFNSRRKLMNHESDHTGVKRYNCNVCGKGYNYKNNFTTHIRLHIGNIPFQCNVCHKRFNNQSNLKRHSLIHTGDRPYVCDLCDRSFNQKCSLDNHKRRTHNGNEHHVCNVCNRSFSRLGALKIHAQSHRRGELYVCDVCGKSFYRKDALQSHSQTHSSEKAYVCDVCGKSFTQKSLLVSHSSVHTGEKRYICEVCGKGFNHMSSFNSHSLIHTGVKPFECDVCHQSFRRKIQLIIHLRSHMGEKPYQCKICNRRFHQKCNLMYHAVAHTNNKNYNCKICNKPFKFKGNLKRHELIHSGYKPYVCDVCHKSFNQKSSLNVHMRSHTGEKPFACSVCDKSFAEKGTLTKHERASHKR